MAGRARNIVHRSGVLAGVGGVTFAVTFGLLLWFTRTERVALQRVPVPADTLDLARAAASMRRLQFRADSVLADVAPPRRVAARAAITPDSAAVTALGVTAPDGDSMPRAAVLEAPAITAVDSATISERIPDSVRIAASALTARLERAQNAPLAASWRALASDPLLQQDPKVRAMADELASAERARNEYDAVGGVDPIYLELSSRVTSLGRAIERSAMARIAAMLRSQANVAAPTIVQPVGVSADELARRFVAESARYVIARARRDDASRVADSVARLLSMRRTEAMQRDSARARAQRRVEALAPPPAMLGASAAAAIGLALLVTILLEIRAPRLADEPEVATQARVPVLLSIRTTDAATPGALTSAFSQLVFDLEEALAATRTLLVVSDEARLAARTASHIAERLGYDGRSVRVVLPQHGTARLTTRRRGRATPTSIQSVLVQPERNHGVAWTGEFHLDALHDDTITIRAGVITDVRASLGTMGAASQVLLVVRIGSTPTDWLVRIRAEIQKVRGTSAVGVVIWAADTDDEDPIQYALDAALQRALEMAPSPGR